MSRQHSHTEGWFGMTGIIQEDKEDISTVEQLDLGAGAARPGELEHGQNEESPNKSSPTYSVKDNGEQCQA